MYSNRIVSYVLASDTFNVRWIDDEVVHLLGFTPEEACQPGWWVGHLHPEDRESVLAETASLLSDSQILNREYRFLGKDGRPVWFHDQLRLSRDASGATKLIGVWTEITEHKELQASFQRAEKRFKVMFEQAPVGVAFIHTEHGNITEVSPMFGKILGRSADDLTHTTLQGLFLLDESFTTLERHPREIRCFRSDGVELWVRITLARIQIESDPETQYLCMIEDVTEKHRTAMLVKEYQIERIKRLIYDTVGTVAGLSGPPPSGNELHEQEPDVLAVAIGAEMGLNQSIQTGLRVVSSFLDVGTVAVPEEILLKKGPLDPDEFEKIKAHAEEGYRMLLPVKSPWPLAEIVRQHHERMDGSGYPRGLKGDEILVEARILAVANVVEAMASHRAYRPTQLGIDAALNEIESNADRLYDANVVAACLRLFREKGFRLAARQRH